MANRIYRIVWQGLDAKTKEYQDIPSFRNAAGQDASAYKM